MKSTIQKAAALLGRKGGSVRSEAKRKSSCENGRRHKSAIDWSRVDWSKPDVELAEELKVSRQTIWRHRP